jgi:hypothetical protein
MGYRSDVMAVFYTYDPNEYPAMKLFIDENVPEFFRSDEYMRLFSGGMPKQVQGIKFTMNGMKWYPSYPDVQGFEQAIEKFEKLSDGGDKWLWEFVRLGEEVEDVEDKSCAEAESLLYVNRSIECDF